MSLSRCRLGQSSQHCPRTGSQSSLRGRWRVWRGLTILESTLSRPGQPWTFSAMRPVPKLIYTGLGQPQDQSGDPLLAHPYRSHQIIEGALWGSGFQVLAAPGIFPDHPGIGFTIFTSSWLQSQNPLTLRSLNSWFLLPRFCGAW